MTTHTRRSRTQQALSMDIVNIALSKFKLNKKDNCIVEYVGRDEVSNFFDKNKVSFRYAFIPANNSENQGSLIILEWTRSIHEAVSQGIAYSLVLGGFSNAIGTGNTDFVIGGVIKKADGGIHPQGIQPYANGVFCGTSDGQVFPNVVWEIAYMNEDEERLIQELLLWISPLTSVQVAIGVKIIDHRLRDNAGNIIGDVNISVYMYRKQQNPPITAAYHKSGILIPQFPPEVRFDFGKDTDLTNKFLSFPVADFYFGLPLAELSPQVQNDIANHAMSNIPLARIRDIAIPILP
jgi:hypothetical protein